MNYKSQLKAYSKKLFDPFCRRSRISFQIPKYDAFITTVGKLNFFRWALEKNVINYIKENFKEIELQHTLYQKEANNTKKTPSTDTSLASTTSLTSIITTTSISSNTSKKNQTKRIHTHDTPVVVSFV
jgi:hypothetical protein